jgi:hypothetical protein
MLRRLGWLVALVLAVATLVVPAGPAAAAPNGYVAYVDEGEIWIGTVDLGAGSPTITPVGSTGLSSTLNSPQSLTFHPAGFLVLMISSSPASANVLVPLDATTATPFGSITLDTDSGNTGIAITARGDTFVSTGNVIRAVDDDTGVTTPVATVGGTAVTALAARCIDHLGNSELFGISPGDEQLSRIDVTAGTGTALPESLGVGVNSTKIGFDADGVLWGLNVTSVAPSTFTIDTSTGAATTVDDNTPLSAYGLAIAPSTCPQGPDEPPQFIDAVPIAAEPITAPPRFTG